MYHFHAKAFDGKSALAQPLRISEKVAALLAWVPEKLR